LVLVRDLERRSLKARSKDKHVLELSFLHVLGESNDKDGRDFFLDGGADRSVGNNSVVTIVQVDMVAVGAIREAVVIQTRAERGRGCRQRVCQAKVTESIAQASDVDAVRAVVVKA